MQSAIAGEVRSFVITNFLFGQADGFRDEDSFLEKGLLDSTGILELVTHLEEAYEIEITEDELVPDNLDSINQIALYLSRKLEGRSLLLHQQTAYAQ